MLTLNNNTSETEPRPQEEERQPFIMPDDSLATAKEIMLHRNGQERVLVCTPPEDYHPRGDADADDLVATLHSPYEAYADGDKVELNGSLHECMEATANACWEERENEAFYLWVEYDGEGYPTRFDLTDEVSQEPDLTAYGKSTVRLMAVVEVDSDAVDDAYSDATYEVGKLISFLRGEIMEVRSEVLEDTETPGLQAWQVELSAYAYNSDQVPSLADSFTGGDDNDWCWFQRDRNDRWEVSVSVP